MNLIAGWKRHGELPMEESDDRAMSAQMRQAAVEMRPESSTELRLNMRIVDALRSSVREADRLHSLCMDGGRALERLRGDIRLMTACAVQARREGVRGLPSADGTPRIERIMSKLCGRGDVRLTKERLLMAIASFDDVQALTMNELWAVPEALRICLCRAYVQAAQEAMRIAEERMRAERWSDRGGTIRKSDAFIEHALQLASERGDSGQKSQLEEAVSGDLAETIVQRAHERESVVLMRLGNLMDGKRMLDALDWSDCFEMLSGVEQELRYDPTGIYPAMEEDSRAAVRTQVTALARRLSLNELTIARHAVRAAEAAVEACSPKRCCTVCYWLYDDEGRRALMRRMGGNPVGLRRMAPDPSGRFAAAAIAALFACLYGLYLSAVKDILFAMMGIPLAWCAAMAVIGRVFPMIFRPAKLLKLRMECVPDELRTLVAMPALLSSPERAEEICGNVEALGCLERDDNIRYLILGDFADGDAEHADGDEEILSHVRARIRKMNDRAGCEKFFYLHRSRSLLKADGKWMGRDRKRGALMDLNRLLLGESGTEEAFSAEGNACEKLRGFRYVLTVDADTRFLPGSVQRLIGTLAHPLNAYREDSGGRYGYAVLQPQMEMAADACVNGFVRLFGGSGGMNTYPSSVSNYWQDVTGEGLFGGKGLYDVRAFHQALDGALPEGRILSHDLIEGTLAGAAQVSDVCFYDGYPAALTGFLRRLHRWTRGDWQLLPILIGVKKYPAGGKRLSFAQRIRMLDNLLRSLFAPSLLGLLIQSVWTGNTNALMTGILLVYLTPVLYLFSGDKLKWRRATAELTLLPVTAACQADAVIRTLWRLVFSGRHLMDWVPSAEAEKTTADHRLPGRIAAILLLPGLFVPGWSAASIALAALFLAGPGWISDMEEGEEEAFSPDQAKWLRGLAEDIWKFFDEHTVDLPPDNVQVDPPVGEARRTSPTNIGLYMMSCVSAEKLGLIDREALSARLERTVCVLEKMDKWNGHLYNWYDIDSKKPMQPEYVSSVDSGNLAASLLLCAEAQENGMLAQRMRRLARQMDFAALYDGERNLFRIGMDVSSGRLSESHYDLLASESRILSYTAMMLGAVPLKHWTALGRTAADAREGAALASWSGTMFEYLMPELFMHAPENTLLGRTVRTAVNEHRREGEARNRPWGISESGYSAFDLKLNYQYRAFGLRALSLSGQAVQDVVAPYASLLALCALPDEAVKNAMEMEKLGWRGEYGLYEAADYLHVQSGGSPRLVRSFMAHHQGMALCAICNAMTKGSLHRAFMGMPEARALNLLLQERYAERTHFKRAREERVQAAVSVSSRMDRKARADQRIADTHLLGGAGATALVTADGAVHYQRDGICATRLPNDLLNRSDGACVHVQRPRTGEEFIIGGQAVYMPGGAIFHHECGDISFEMQVSVSPEDGTLHKRIMIQNKSEVSETVNIADCAPVALGKEQDMLAHQTFQNLFVESRRAAQSALMLRRRQREREGTMPVMLHLVASPGSVQFETDYEKLVGREGSVMQPGGIHLQWSGTLGDVLNPCSALMTTVNVRPGQSLALHFSMALQEADRAEEWLLHNFAESAPERSFQLSTMQAQTMLGFIGLDARQAHLLSRFSAMLFDGHLCSRSARQRAEPVPRERLWALGVSGDHPIMTVTVARAEEMKTVREAVRAHEYFCALGVRTDLVILDMQKTGYERPVREAVREAVGLSAFGGGSIHIADGSASGESLEALFRASVLTVDASQDFFAQVRMALAPLEMQGKKPVQMDTGESRLPPLEGKDNGYGAFLADGRYAIDVAPGVLTPAPWSNILANDDFGILVTERGGGFLWHENSRNGRLTAFPGDTLSEGWGWMLYLVREDTGEFLRLLPGKEPNACWRAVYAAAETVFRLETEQVFCETELCVKEDAPELRVRTTVRCVKGGSFRLVGFVDWLMGVDARDAAFVRTWTRDGACFASGTAQSVGYFASSSAKVQAGGDRTAFLGRGGVQCPTGVGSVPARSGGWVLNVPVALKDNTPIRTDWTIGAAEDTRAAEAAVRRFYAHSGYDEVREAACAQWRNLLDRLRVETPDENVNRMANGWLQHQTLTSRIRSRTGLYQPGGAYGFRDQLQDMLALILFEPDRVRAHLLKCAAHQFEDGDVMHWWHEPYQGVRTKISDDMLFLPFVTAQYVRMTGDVQVLSEEIPYLKNIEIEEGREDRYAEMLPGKAKASLHDHCMRAFRRAYRTGGHGLMLMGSGDWNDGMNRIGAQGKGESVWLSEFISVCSENYASVSPDAEDAAWLKGIAAEQRSAVEESGWDGGWYLRAWTDEGVPVGSAGCDACRIDVLSQAWAVLAGLDSERCRSAIDAAWEQLVSEESGIIRLLTPPFGESGFDPGYIRSYPKGIRENGGQYTHAACWLLLALIEMGDAGRAHRLLKMLLPMRHSDTKEKADRYRVEPYVIAADIYAGEHIGRGGWTWYTGSAAWMYLCILKLTGFERRGDRVRMCPLPGEWDEISVEIRFGSASYRLTAVKAAETVLLDGEEVAENWIRMKDDNRVHTAVFPFRKTKEE